MTILHRFAQAYGHDVSGYPNLEERQNYVRSLLVNRHCLMVLDNADNSHDVSALIPPNGTSAVLITTRHRNLSAIHGAFQLHLRAFRGHTGESEAIFDQIIAERNLLEVGEITHLAALLGHLPLALAIAASRIAYEPFWTAQTFVQHLQEHGLHALENETDSIRATFDLTFERLSDEQRHVFCSLALFAQHSFSPLAVQFLFEGILDSDTILRQLHQLSLLQSPQHYRYQLHPLLNAYAKQKFEQFPDLDCNTLQHRFIIFYADYLAEHSYHYGRIDDEAALITQALQIALEASDYHHIASMLGVFGNYLQSRGLSERAEAYILRAIEMARAHQNDEFLCDMLEYYAYRCNLKGHYAAAARAIKEGLQLAEQLENKDSQYAYWMAICTLHKVFESSIRQPYRQKLENVMQKLTDNPQALYLSNLLGVVAWREGDFTLARSHLNYALAISKSLQHKTPSIQKMDSLIRLNLARTALSEKQCDEARALLHDALQIAQNFAYPPNIGLIYETLSDLSEQEGQLDAENSLKIMQTINFDMAILRLHHRLMLYALQSDNTMKSKHHLEALAAHAQAVERVEIAHAAQICLQEMHINATNWHDAPSFQHLEHSLND